MSPFSGGFSLYSQSGKKKHKKYWREKSVNKQLLIYLNMLKGKIDPHNGPIDPRASFYVAYFHDIALKGDTG